LLARDTRAGDIGGLGQLFAADAVGDDLAAVEEVDVRERGLGGVCQAGYRDFVGKGGWRRGVGGDRIRDVPDAVQGKGVTGMLGGGTGGAVL